MNRAIRRLTRQLIVVAALLLLGAGGAQAMIDGVSGQNFNLTAKADHISTPDGVSLLMWGYALSGARAQYPGPTFIINQGETITINLTNELALPVSLVFPGQANVTATGGTPGLLTQEAQPGDPVGVTYTFTATHAGTYLYHSGTRPELEVEMGLFGAIIVRPYGFNMNAQRAYNHAGSAFDHEYLFLLSEVDPRIHQTIEFSGLAALDTTDYLTSYFPNYWFINGRCAPDTMSMAFTPWLPTQPYDCMPRMHPGERLLMRVVNAGRDLHPFHQHGNHARLIAQDGRLLESASGLGPDLSHEIFTFQAVPGSTMDGIFTWTGQGMGWDIYGTGPEHVHACSDANGDGYDDVTSEWCADHGKPFPVLLPEAQELTFGGMYGGSPFLGTLGSLPPGEGGLNPNAGFVFMWHSHTEKEMTNWDIFPGGMMTMLIIEPPGVPIP